jgi:hypothetical protein
LRKNIVSPEEFAHSAERYRQRCGPRVIDDQLAVFHVITEERHAAHLHALFLGRGDLVAGSFAGDFPLELGEGQKDIQRQLSHADGSPILPRRGVSFVSITQRSGQPIDFVNDDHVDLACLDIGDQPFQGSRSIVPPESTDFLKNAFGFKPSELMADFLTAMIERTLDTCCAPRHSLTYSPIKEE